MASTNADRTRSPAAIAQYFEALPTRVFRKTDLRTIFRDHVDDWHLMGASTAEKFVTILLETSQLRRVRLESEHYRSLTRYSWGDVRPYELALSLGKAPYLSHASAMALHGLSDQIPKAVYVNDEQSPKNLPPASLTQQAIDRAFVGSQRTSRAAYTAGGLRVVVISGKHTGRLEVGQRKALDGTTVDVTKVERTLIDIAVRPDYAGGPYQVLDAYVTARDRVSVNVLVATLKKLSYAYPYHQVIGFYMQRAGYALPSLEHLRRLGLQFDFYLAYGMKAKQFDQEWRLYVPKGF